MFWMFSSIFLLTKSYSWFISGYICIHENMNSKPFPFVRVMFFENFSGQSFFQKPFRAHPWIPVHFP